MSVGLHYISLKNKVKYDVACCLFRLQANINLKTQHSENTKHMVQFKLTFVHKGSKKATHLPHCILTKQPPCKYCLP